MRHHIVITINNQSHSHPFPEGMAPPFDSMQWRYVEMCLWLNSMLKIVDICRYNMILNYTFHGVYKHAHHWGGTIMWYLMF